MIIKGRNRKTGNSIAGVLRRGGIVIMVCDTIYGIIGSVPGSETRIRTIKGRNDGRPFLQLLSSKKDLRKYSLQEIPGELLKLWPGPLTIIVGNRQGGTTAFRVPNDPFLRRIIKKSEGPVYSTSVNKSDEPPEWKIDSIIGEYESEVDLILDDGDLKGRQPSTLIDISKKPYRIVRQGALQISEEIMAALGIVKNGE